MLASLININNTYKKIKLSQIKRNPMQPRKYFNIEAINELAESIKYHGILNPLTVRRSELGYELIAGERRLRAAKLAGLAEVPCIILTATEEQSSILAMVENLQRQDLDFFEEALGYKKLISIFELTQDDVAKQVGKTQSSIANKLRLLNLSDLVCSIIRENQLTERHARALLKINDEELQLQVLDHIIKYSLNVSKSEQYIEEILTPTHKGGKIVRFIKDVRFFINTVDKAVNIMRSAGVEATVEKKENEQGGICLQINIPKAKP